MARSLSGTKPFQYRNASGFSVVAALVFAAVLLMDRPAFSQVACTSVAPYNTSQGFMVPGNATSRVWYFTASPAGCAWSVANVTSWMTVTSTSVTSPYSVAYDIAANPDPVTRVGGLDIVSNGSVLSHHFVNQNTPLCTFQMSPPALSFGLSGGSGSINVTTSPAGAGCEWIPQSGAAWLSGYPTLSLVGDQPFTFSVQALSGVPSRSTTFTLYGGTTASPTVTINQDGSIKVSVTTNLSGLTFTVDGTTYSSAQTFLWAAGSSHAIATTSLQGSGPSRSVFASWSDGGAISHSITVPGADTAYTANFATQYLLTAATSPAAGGTIVASPVSPDGYYASGASVQLTAVPNAGYSFSGWSGALTGAINPQSVTMSAARSVTASFVAAANIGVTSNPPGLSFTVDGTTYVTGQSFSWTPGSSHTIATTSPQGTGSSRSVFSTWSDGGTISHSVTAPALATTYTANFTTQYLLTAAASPVGGGTMVASPASPDGYYASGTSVQLTAVPNAGYTFSGWGGDITGSTNPQSVAMSAARSVTANFLASVNIGVTTNPPGLSFTVDGTTYVIGQSFSWTPGTSHTIATTSPQGSGTSRSVFASWSDGGTISHSVTTPAFATTYTATFATQYLLTATASPAAGGAIVASPASPDGYYASGTSVQMTAVVNPGYTFIGWTGALTGVTNPQSISMLSARSVTATFSANTGITVATNPPGVSFTVDGVPYTTAQNFTWPAGTSHAIATSSPQEASGVRFVFAGWSDGGAIAHAISVPASAATYTANFTTQYRLTTAVSPAAGGAIAASPASPDGYYESGTSVRLTATANPGYTFTGWGGDLTGSVSPQSVTLSAARSVSANFVQILPINISSLSPSRTAAAASAFTLSVNGSGFLTGISTVYWNGVPLVTNYVSGTQLTARIDPVFIAYPGPAAITVGNPGSSLTSNTLPFTIDPPPSPKPAIASMTPVATVAGNPAFDLQVYGTNFLPNSVVRWNGVDRFTIFLSSKQLRATIAAEDISSPGQRDITVASPGILSGAMTFVVSNPAPVITALSPPAVVAGSQEFALTVFGMNFVNGAAVLWNGQTRQTTFVSNSQLRAVIPAADTMQAGNFNVTVLNADGTKSAGRSISAIALPPNAPNITGVSPNPIAAGGPAFTLSVFGTGFLPNSTVQWNGQNRTTRFISATEVRADILSTDIAAAGAYTILVNNPTSSGAAGAELAGGASLGLTTVTAPVPIITKIAPGSSVAGVPGLRLEIEGYGFVKDTTYVQWNDRRIPAVFTSGSRIEVDVPAADVAAAGTLSFSVLNPPPGGGASDTLTFTIIPQKTPVLQLFYPRLESSSAANATENTGIAIANLSGKDAAITLRAFGKDGNEIAGPRITNPVALSISGVEQRAITDSQVFGSGLPEQKAVGWIKLESSEAKIAGFFLVFDNNLQTLDGADVSSEVTRSFVFPELADVGFNQYHLANPGASAASVTFELVGRDGGGAKATVVRSINPNGTLAEFFTDLFPGITPSSTDYIRVNSNVGLVPFSYMGQQGRDAKGLNGQDATKGTTTLYSPQYVVGAADWSTTLSIVNLDTASTTVTLRFISDDGTQIGTTQVRSIAGKGKLYVGNQDFFVSAGQLMQGYVEVISSSGQLVGNVVFGDPQAGRYTAALPLVSSLRTAMVFGQVASGLIGDKSYFTGLAMLNPGGKDAHVSIELFDRDGRLVTSSSETIPAKRRKSKLLTEYFPGLTGQNIGSGYIKVTSDEALASFALFGSLEALSAVPAQVIP
jgi:uncharacterized repeat protein (TIGR02543 family)